MDKNELLSLSNDFNIVFFDGVCNLCNHTVGFIDKRDPHSKFRFLALQDPLAQASIAVLNGQKPVPDSVILVSKGKIYMESQAALQIARRLSGGWPLFYWGFGWWPGFILNPIYKFIARNRYKWFGKQDACPIPSAALRSKFLKIN